MYNADDDLTPEEIERWRFEAAERAEKITSDPRYVELRPRWKALYEDGRVDEHIHPVDMIDYATTLDGGFRWMKAEIERLESIEPNPVLLA